MTPQVLIHTIVQQTVVFIAQLATAGGVRAPLAQIADQVFHGLAQELRAQGIRQNVIADMFGLAVRTYHRRVQSAEQSKSVEGNTVWAAVLDHIKQQQPISAAKVQQRFSRDEPEVVSGVLRDLAHSGLVYRAGRGANAVFRVADASDFDTDDSAGPEHLIWLVVYRSGPMGIELLAEQTGLGTEACESALGSLIADGRVTKQGDGRRAVFSSERFEVMPESERGWEAAVLDHYQAMLSAIRIKLSQAERHSEWVGGSTWSLDVWRGHPLEQRAKESLGRVRRELSSLRAEVDAHNAAQPSVGSQELHRVVVYAGQYVADIGKDASVEEETMGNAKESGA